VTPGSRPFVPLTPRQSNTRSDDNSTIAESSYRTLARPFPQVTQRMLLLHRLLRPARVGVVVSGPYSQDLRQRIGPGTAAAGVAAAIRVITCWSSPSGPAHLARILASSGDDGSKDIERLVLRHQLKVLRRQVGP
jgi:hypothetical protein